METLRAVTFDCWNTLIHERSFEPARRLRVAAVCDLCGEAGRPVSRETAVEWIAAAHARHIALWDQGEGTWASDMAEWVMASGGIDEPDLTARLGRHFEEAGLASEIEALPGAREALASLAERGIRLALVCDTGFSSGRIVREYLRRVGMLDPLEVLIFSDEVRVPKPHPRMFEAALAALGVEPRHAIHVGDLRRTDVGGARAFGMRTVRIRATNDDRSELPDADWVTDSHAEILGIVDRQLSAASRP